MSVKCVVADTNIIEIDRDRYDELIVKENRLQLLEKAIANKDDIDNFKDIKTILNLEKEVTENEYDTHNTNDN